MKTLRFSSLIFLSCLSFNVASGQTPVVVEGPVTTLPQQTVVAPARPSWKFPFSFTGWRKKAAHSEGQFQSIAIAGSPTSPEFRKSKHCETFRPRRVVIVTPRNRQDRLLDQDLFGQSLATHLSAIGLFDTVVSQEHICEEFLPQRKGVFDERRVLEYAKEHHADAILFCDVNIISGYAPMHIRPSVVLVHASQCVALLDARMSLSTSDTIVHQQYAQYVSAHCRDARTELYRHTPRFFIDFGAKQIADLIATAW